MWVLFGLTILLLLVVGLHLFGLWPGQLRVPVATAAETDAFLLSSLCFAAQRVNLFAEQNGRLPESLPEAGIPADSNWGFRRLSESRYWLSFQDRGRSMSYDSAEPFERFFAEELSPQQRGR